MEKLTIFLCIVIGHAFCVQQRIAMGKDEFRAIEEAREGLSLYVKEAIKLDQYLQSKYDVQVQTKSDSSNETKTDEKPLSLELRSPLTSGAYEVKSGGRKVYLETREAQLSLVKHSDRNTSAKKDSTKFRSLPVKSAAIRYSGEDFSIKASRSLRMKRDALDSFNKMLEPAFEVLHPEPHRKKHRGKKTHKHKKKNKYAFKERLLVVPLSKEEDSPVTIPETGEARTAAVSHSAMRCLINKLPDVLKSKILITDDAEELVLENFIRSKSISPQALDAYKSAKKNERELLKRLLKDIPIILLTYKSIRKGVAWNHTRLHDKFKEFFQTPSPTLENYEAFKKDEFSSLDKFLSGSGDDASWDAKTFELQETQIKVRKVRAIEKDKTAAGAGAEEAEIRRRDENAKYGEADKQRVIKERDDEEEEEDEKEEDEEEKDEEEEDEEEEDNEEEGEEEEDQDADESADDNMEEAEEEETEKDKAEKGKNEKKEKKEKEEDKAEDAKKEKKEKKEEEEGKKGKKGEKEKGKSESGFNDPPVTCDVEILMSKSEIKEMIDSHNDARRREKAADMLKIKWDPILAKLAQQKASACEWGHSMLKDCTGRGLGQSIWANWNNDGKEFVKLNITEVTYAWADEYKDWNYKTKTCNPGKVCGHWEMLTGGRVQTVGCGTAKCIKMKMGDTSFGHANYVVCDYYPYYTKFEEGKECTKCASSAATTPEKGYTCEKKLCVPCEPKKDKDCKSASNEGNQTSTQFLRRDL